MKDAVKEMTVPTKAHNLCLLPVFENGIKVANCTHPRGTEHFHEVWTKNTEPAKEAS
jgi:hypothetical protein